MVAAVSRGMPPSQAAKASGVPLAMHKRWMAAGEAGELDDQGRPTYINYYNDIQMAEAQAEDEVAQVYRAAALDNWNAAASYLERRWPERWGKVDRLKAELTGAEGSPIETRNSVNLGSLSDEELSTLERIVGGNGNTDGPGNSAGAG